MKNKLKFIPFLLAVPLLFMANSPAPGPESYAYTDYLLSNLVFEEADSSGKYPFSLTIENTGDKYIALGSSFLEGGFHFTNQYGSYDLLVAPHSSGTYVSCNATTKKFTLEEKFFSCEAYAYSGAAEYSNIEFVSKDDNYSSTYYRFEIKDYQTPTEDRYAKIVNVSIKGESMCFINKGYNNQIYIELYDDTLNPEDFVFESIALTKYRQMNGLMGDMAKLLRWMGIVMLAGLGFIAVSAAIFFPTFFGIRKKRRANAQIPPSENG